MTRKLHDMEVQIIFVFFKIACPSKLNPVHIVLDISGCIRSGHPVQIVRMFRTGS